jgi:N-sulfoglucosamine sulfohydrolase
VCARIVSCVSLSSETAGASFAYTTETGTSPRWKLSTGAIELATPVTVRLKACRLGYLDTEVVAREYR